MSLTHPRKAAGAAVIAALAALAAQASLAAGAAQASTYVEHLNNSATLYVFAQPGKFNTITITTDDFGDYRVTDGGDQVDAGVGCSRVNDHTVSCSDFNVTDIYVEAADLNDTVTVDARADVVLEGGTGNDELNAAAATGWNFLRGGSGTDVLTGGPDYDSLVGGTGNDTLNGGAGLDRALYSERTAPVTVTLDGVANDGQVGEGDNVKTDVEEVKGGAGDDTLTGNAAVNTLLGEGGRDRLNGQGSGDALDGGPGDDVLDGGTGPDNLFGGSGRDRADYSARTTSVIADIDGVADDGATGEGDNLRLDMENITGGSRSDTLTGSSADNTLVGGAGGDNLWGLEGNDDLDAFDGISGNDWLRGGPGVDSCDFDDGPEDGQSDHAFGCG